MSSLSTDHPISTPSDDLLNRSSAISSFVKQVLELDPSFGFVVGVLGLWGSGKTSFLNLARLDLEKSGITVLDFNPWMFSGADHLVELFFAEISAQLKLKEMKEVGSSLSPLAVFLLTWAGCPLLVLGQSVCVSFPRTWERFCNTRKVV